MTEGVIQNRTTQETLAPVDPLLLPTSRLRADSSQPEAHDNSNMLLVMPYQELETESSQKRRTRSPRRQVTKKISGVHARVEVGTSHKCSDRNTLT